MKRDEVIIGVDVGGTNIRIGAVGEEMALEAFQKIPRREVLNGSDSIGSLVRFVKAYVEKELRGKTVLAIALGFPATVDRERKVVISTPNIPNFNNMRVVEEMGRELPFPVFIERDVTMLFYYDLYRMRLPGDGIGIGVYFGTGVGNVVSVGGNLLVGKHGVACELGHIPVSGSDVLCGCGNKGCLECLGAGKYLDSLIRDVYPDTHISRLFAEHGEEELLKRFIDTMAIGVATEINILDPDYVILGGGVLGMERFPLERLLSDIHRHARKPYPDEDLTIRLSENSPQNGVVGAMLYAKSRLERA